MRLVSHRVAPFYPQLVPFEVASERVVFGGAFLSCWHVQEAASGGIVVEIDTATVAVLIPLPPWFSCVVGIVGATPTPATWARHWSWYGSCQKCHNL